MTEPSQPDPDIEGSDFEAYGHKTQLGEAVKGDRRAQLEAIRDYIARELDGNMCNKCLSSKLRTGDQASLILRLQAVLAEIEALPVEGEVNRLDNVLSLVPDPVKQNRTGTRKQGGGRKAN